VRITRRHRKHTIGGKKEVGKSVQGSIGTRHQVGCWKIEMEYRSKKHKKGNDSYQGETGAKRHQIGPMKKKVDLQDEALGFKEGGRDLYLTCRN